MAQMPMSVNFQEIELCLSKLGKVCQSGELNSAQKLFVQLDEKIRYTLTPELLSTSPQAQQAALNIYEQLNQLSIQLTQNKKVVAKELTQYLGNKKKINTYKNT